MNKQTQNPPGTRAKRLKKQLLRRVERRFNKLRVTRVAYLDQNASLHDLMLDTSDVVLSLAALIINQEHENNKEEGKTQNDKNH